MKLNGIRLPGYRLSKSGKLERNIKRLSVSQQLQKKAKTKIRVGKK